MAEIVTLELPDDVADRARETARRTGQPLEQVLTDWLERAATSTEATTWASGTEYPIYTPYGNEEAAQVLSDALAAATAKNQQPLHDS